jgi:hypothetical protein
VSYTWRKQGYRNVYHDSTHGPSTHFSKSSYHPLIPTVTCMPMRAQNVTVLSIKLKLNCVAESHHFARCQVALDEREIFHEAI